MKYYSLKDPSINISFREATLQGQAADKGLFFPVQVPIHPNSFFQQIEHYSREEIAYQVLRPYMGSEIPDQQLHDIVEETINFSIPLVPLMDHIHCLELFHGPTLAFKDVGARFMSRCLGYFVRNNNREITVLVATSGDTGGAVASGFFGVEGIRVVILYPSGKVSPVQELQLTTLGGNITALEVGGNFDDCQQLVKEAFGDSELKEHVQLTSANSINVARWLPQQVYYFLAWQQWPYKQQAPVVSVPSGNFGNLGAGLLAFRSGFHIRCFIAACNDNEVVPNYLRQGKYTPQKAIATLSNAMDVGDPSNFVRILELFGQDLNALKTALHAESITDEETRNTIKEVYQQFNYTLDPHGAVSYAALQHYLNSNKSERGYFLETAHPIKFYETIEPAIGQTIDKQSINALVGKQKSAVKIANDYKELKAILMQ